MVRSGDPNLDEFISVVSQSDYRTEVHDGHLLSYFPIGTSIMTIPALYLLDAVFIFHGFDFYEYLQRYQPDKVVWKVELWLASIIAAISAVCWYFVSRKVTEKEWLVLLSVIVFAFGTAQWSVVSRALWSHGPSVLVLSVMLFLLLSGHKGMWTTFSVGVLSAIAFFIRPTNAVVVLVSSLYFLTINKRHVFSFLTGALAVFVVGAIYHLGHYGVPLPSYFTEGRLAFSTAFVEAFIGNVVSPNRGLLVFQPVYLLGVICVVVFPKRNHVARLHYAILAVIFLHWVLISVFPHWWAGHSFGQRFWSDITPLMMLFVLEMINNVSAKKNTIMIVVVLALIFLSLFIQYRGANSWKTWEWNVLPVNVDLNPSRVWDITDIQFLRN